MTNTTNCRNKLRHDPAGSVAAGPVSRWRQVTTVVALVAAFGTTGLARAYAEQASPSTIGVSQNLPLPPAPVAPAASALDIFDTSLLQMVNAKRAAAGLPALKEVLGLDKVSGNWSQSVVAKGRYGTVTTDSDVTAQAKASGAPKATSTAQSVAKWYPQTVKAADAFGLLAGYSDAVSKMQNSAFSYVGIDTAVADDGTSVASFTYADSADPAQVVDPANAFIPTGAMTAATQTAAVVRIQGNAADKDASSPVQVQITDSVGSTTVSKTVSASDGRFDGSITLTSFGTHTVCATVINQGAGRDLSLGCTTAKSLASIIGNADTLRQSGDKLTATGWGYDPSDPNTALTAVLTTSGPSGTSTVKVLSDTLRPDVPRVYPDAGAAHGYRVTVPTMGQGVNKMCMTLLGTGSGAPTRNFTCKTITVS